MFFVLYYYLVQLLHFIPLDRCPYVIVSKFNMPSSYDTDVRLNKGISR